MALETGVQIKLEVTGEQLLKQAFESVKIAARGLETQGLTLNETLKKLEGTEKETINTYRKSSNTLKSAQEETVLLAKQYEMLAKYTGISQKEARMLALAQDDLVKKADELNYRGKVKTNYINSQNKQIIEQIRLNNQFKNAIEDLSNKEQGLFNVRKRMQKEVFAGDNAVALFRANEIAKQKEIQATLDLQVNTGDAAVNLFRANEIKKANELKKRLDLELTAGDDAVMAFRANEIEKAKAIQGRLDDEKFAGDNAVTLFRANEIKKSQELQKRLDRELTTGDDAVIAFRANEIEKAKAIQKRLDDEKFAGDNAVNLFRANEVKKVNELQKRLDAEKSAGNEAVALFRSNEIAKAQELQKRLDAEKFAGDGAVTAFRKNEIEKQKELQRRFDAERFAGDNAVAAFRANEIKKANDAKSLEDSIRKSQEQRMQSELSTGDQMVALFRANEIKKQNAVIQSQTAQINAGNTARRQAEAQYDAIEKELKDIQRQSELTAQGLSKMTAGKVIKLQDSGATQQQINQFIQLRKQIESLDPAVRKTTASFTGLSAVVRQILPTVGAIGVGSALTQTAIAAIRVADSMSLLKSRMKLTLDETQNFEEVYSGLVETAINNRASLTDTVTLFTRLSPALKAAGIETGAAATVIDSFQKTLLISGATVRETSSAILQFSQAMAAGRLNGDEFRSISEAAPEFLRAFSRATGVAAGALKELSAEGALTTEVITAAMIVMNEELTKTAKGIDLTFGQSIQILGTRLSEMVDRVNESTGFTKALAEATFDLSNIVKSATDFITQNKEAVASLVSGLGEFLKVASAVALVYGTLKLGAMGLAAAKAILAPATALAASSLVLYAEGAAVSTVATTALGVAVKGLLSATGIGAIAVILGTAAVAFSDYIFTSDEAKVKAEEVTVATQEETRAIEEARAILQNFGITYGSAGGVAGEYRKKTQELTDAYIRQKVGAEGLYLIEKNMLELQKAKILQKASEISLSNKYTAEMQKEFEGLVAQADAIDQYLGLLELTEQQRKDIENARKNDKSNSQEEKALGRLSKQISDLIAKYQDYSSELSDIEKAEIALNSALRDKLITQKEYNAEFDRLSTAKNYKETIDLVEGYNDLAKSQNKVFEETQNQTKSYEEQLFETQKQILSVGKNKDELLLLEQAKLDDAIATLIQEKANRQGIAGQEQQVEAYEKQIKVIQELKKAKGKLSETEASVKAAEDTRKEFEKIQDDIAKSVGDAIIAGGQKGKDILKNMLKAQVFRIFIEPEIRDVAGKVTKAISGKGSLSDLSGLVETLAASSLGGGEAVALQAGLQQLAVNPQILTDIGNKIFFDASSEFLSSTGKLLADSSNAISSFAGELAPYAGSIISFVNGDYASGIGSAAGVAIATAFGQALGSFAGPIGAFIGGIIGEKLLGGLFGGGKISATGLDPSFGKGVVDNLNTQYTTLVDALGGTKNTGVSFGAGGNTGRQGQNPNFNIGASLNGSQIFNSNQTAEGQADGLFLSGEVALNEANLTDQSTRALIAVLQKTKFDKNIEDVFKGVSAASSSLEELNNALSDAQLLRKINTEFANLDGSLKTLAGTSIETVKTFIALAGGVDKLAELQGQYIQNIYSEEQKLKLATDNLNAAFDGLNLSVPKSTEEFKALVDAQNLSTIQGQATYLSLLQLSGAFKEVKDAQQQALEEQVAEQARVLEDQKRAASEAAEALKELADAFDELNSKTQDYISEITNGAMSAIERNALDINKVISSIGSEQDALEKIALQNELSDLIFERYQLEKEQIEGLQSLIQEVFSAIQTEADAVNQARDNILGVQTTTGSRDSISGKINQVRTGLGFDSTAAQSNLTAEIERFKSSSLNAVTALGKLREETTRYYEQQKALADLMKGTAKSIRESIKQTQLSDLTPQQQVQKLEAEFSSLYANALVSSGSVLADTGSQLQALIGPLLEKASEAYASGPEFQRIKELVLGQAGTVADKLDSLAPENYQQESLGLLDQIDQSLIDLMGQADLANQTLVASLETASDRAVAALNNLLVGLTGQTPVVESTLGTPPVITAPVATITTADITSTASTGGSFGAIVDELKALREDVKNSGDINIKVVTTDGKVIVDETLTQIKARSKKGELVIYADGVK